MNISGYVRRAIYAIIACVILVFVFNAIVKAFVPGLFSGSQLQLIDILIYIAGFCYVVFGESWFV